MGTTVTVKAMSDVARLLGWSEREVQFEGDTLGHLLASLSTSDGLSLHARLVTDGVLRGGWVVTVNGEVVTRLDSPLRLGDRVVTMEMVRLFHGG